MILILSFYRGISDLFADDIPQLRLLTYKTFFILKYPHSLRMISRCLYSVVKDLNLKLILTKKKNPSLLAVKIRRGIFCSGLWCPSFSASSFLSCETVRFLCLEDGERPVCRRGQKLFLFSRMIQATKSVGISSFLVIMSDLNHVEVELQLSCVQSLFSFLGARLLGSTVITFLLNYS